MKRLGAIMTAIFPIALACTWNVHAEVYQGETYGEQHFGSWAGVLTRRGDDARFRAYTTAGNWALYFDVMPPNCTVMVSLMLSMGTDAMQTDVPAFDFVTTARIDQNDPFDWRFQGGATMGDQALLFTAYALPDLRPVLDQMENGQTMRTKLAVNPNSPSYATFALNGFGNAFEFEVKQCELSQRQPQKGSAAPKKSAPSKPPPGATSVL